MRKHQEPRPRDDRDTIKDIARDLAETATHIGQLKGEANAYLTKPGYDRLKLRLENALSAVEAAAIEARRRVRLNEGIPHTEPSDLAAIFLTQHYRCRDAH